MKSLQILLSAFLLLSWTHCSHALKGSVILDSLNFDKIVKRFKFAVIKFDIQYPYGEKHEQFGLVSQALNGRNSEILVGEVGVQDFEDMENRDLGERFQVKKTDFPVILLFKKDDFEHPIRFPFSDDFNADKIKQFVRKETGIKIVLDNCLPEFDELAEKFVNALPEKQKEMIQLASDQMTTLNPNDRKYAEIYFKIMQKMLEKRIDFPEQESGRLSKILQGKLSSTKKKDLESRLNILQSFIKKPFDDAKEEL